MAVELVATQVAADRRRAVVTLRSSAPLPQQFMELRDPKIKQLAINASLQAGVANPGVSQMSAPIAMNSEGLPLDAVFDPLTRQPLTINHPRMRVAGYTVEVHLSSGTP